MKKSHKMSKFLHNDTAENSLPNDKISDWSKLKAFVDDKLDILNTDFSL